MTWRQRETGERYEARIVQAVARVGVIPLSFRGDIFLPRCPSVGDIIRGKGEGGRYHRYERELSFSIIHVMLDWWYPLYLQSLGVICVVVDAADERSNGVFQEFQAACIGRVEL